MTGSSARKLRRSIGNLLGGRALMRHMPPFWACELKDDFSYEKALQVGLIPMIWESPNPVEKLRNYVGVYLREEVQAEGLVRQVGDFSRFLEIASFAHGGLWNSTEIARESQIKRQTVDNYLQILEDLLLAFRLPVFTRRAKRKVISHNKFYYFDVGVFSVLRPQGILDRREELEGAILEGLVAQHLRAWVQAQQEMHQLFFWRTQTGLEVDFIVYGPSGFWAIEVKRSENLSPADVHALTAFKEEYPETQCLILHSGAHSFVYKGFTCLPVRDFLGNLHPNKPIAQPLPVVNIS
jgi:predicted AAA+ superfamily ATPase